MSTSRMRITVTEVDHAGKHLTTLLSFETLHRVVWSNCTMAHGTYVLFLQGHEQDAALREIEQHIQTRWQRVSPSCEGLVQ